MRASNKDQSNLAVKRLVKRCQENEPASISVIFFISPLPERSELPLVEKLEEQENCQSIIFDEQRLHPHGVGN